MSDDNSHHNSRTNNKYDEAASDNDTTLSELKQLYRLFIGQRNWLHHHRAKHLAMAVGTEAAELMEVFRFATAEKSDLYFWDEQKREEITDELADTLAFTISLALKYDVDIVSECKRKLEKSGRKYKLSESKSGDIVSSGLCLVDSQSKLWLAVDKTSGDLRLPAVHLNTNLIADEVGSVADYFQNYLKNFDVKSSGIRYLTQVSQKLDLEFSQTGQVNQSSQREVWEVYAPTSPLSDEELASLAKVWDLQPLQIDQVVVGKIATLSPIVTKLSYFIHEYNFLDIYASKNAQSKQ